MAKLGFRGVMDIETSVAAVTWTVGVVAVCPLYEAVKETAPAALPVARPVAEMEATAGAELVQEAEALTFWVLPSE